MKCKCCCIEHDCEEEMIDGLCPDCYDFLQNVLLKNEKLSKKLNLTEKALELACEEINRVEAKFGSAYIRANGYLVDCFKTNAKEMMKSE